MKKAIGLVLSMIGAAGIASSASAADMPVKAVRAAPAAVYNWSGFYVGVHVGGAWLDHERHEIALPENLADHDASGLIAGGQIGFNVQNGNIVWGIEVQASWSDLDDETPSTLFEGFTKRTEVNWMGTAAGRLGIVTGNMLLFVKAGFAWADYDYQIRLDGARWAQVDELRTGWMVGVGAEYAMSGPWSVKLEYNYMDFGKKSYNFVPVTDDPTERWRVEDSIHVVKFGINYRLGGGAVVARY